MEIHFEIENNCILKCRHCSSNAVLNGLRMDYSEEDMIRLLNYFDEDKKIYLTGGEPLLYPNLEGLIYKLNSQQKINIGMFTSGIVYRENTFEGISIHRAKLLHDNGLNNCYLSVYSDTPDEHDFMTGLDGSFILTERSIRFLIDSNVNVNLNVVVNALNYHKLDKIIDKAKQWGINEVRFLKLIKQGRAVYNWEQIGISDKLYRESCVNMLKKRYDNIKITASGLQDIIPCRECVGINACPAGRKLLYITYRGDIFPCASTKKNDHFCIGNIKDTDIFDKIDQNIERITRITDSMCLCDL